MTDTPRAPFALRCGALLVDYTLLLLPLALTGVLARLFADSGATGRAAEEGVTFLSYALTAGLFVFDFVLLPATIERTLGKWVTGLRIERTNGERLNLLRAALRHLLGYGVTLMTLGAGYLLAALRRDGRALHDLIASTIVVRDHGASRRRART